MRFHVPNVVIYKVFTDGKQTPIIGAYLPPYTLEHLLDLEEALTCFWEQDPIVLGYLNSNIVQAHKLCRQ